MLAERVLSSVMRRENSRLLTLERQPESRLPAPVPGREYLLYVHIPFCTRLCPYCSFNRFPFQESRTVEYFKRLREEMRFVADQGYHCTSMYVGGGTPTVMIDELCDTIDLAKSLFEIREVSSETNPDHLIPRIVDPLVDRVDRFSVGVQSFDDGLLRQMERYDKYGSAAEILERIQSIEGRFHSMNVDMIFNFPSQTEEMLLRDVEMLKASRTNQTTFYPLMASPAVEDSLKRTVGKVSYEREARYYRILSEALSETFEPASSWTFSRTGGGMIDEYIVDYEDYVGIGSGAFSFLDGSLYVNTFSLAEYNERIDAGLTPATGKRSFGLRDRMRYRFLMRLFGLSLDKIAFERDFGVSIDRGLPMEMTFMRVNGAFATDTPERLTLTPKGRYLLVAMMRQFFIGVNNLRDEARFALNDSERELLFGDGECEKEAGLVHAAATTEDAEHLPLP
ncbi:MAG: coproporphyrinogen III oxidase family protein [Anaerosomatales bacterium]|nr:coproporphyrinogen III oxidase family protein [Anaerosomatales bacterium]MDT8434175.1 coproporphyrinogen III oxidase family protein [Anaerosomatales bacterium]